jgi:HEAT repeat protein
MLRASDSPLKTKCIELFDQQYFIKIKITPAWEKGFEAFHAFAALGTEASSAVPNLIEIYNAKIRQNSQVMTAVSIGAIGPAAKSAIPTLMSGLKSTNDTVRWNTVWALGSIHSEPELVVPELVKLLHDPFPLARRFSAEALGKFGTNAESAVPDLTMLLSGQRGDIYQAATNALKQIDPEAAAKAGVK